LKKKTGLGGGNPKNDLLNIEPGRAEGTTKKKKRKGGEEISKIKKKVSLPTEASENNSSAGLDERKA